MFNHQAMILQSSQVMDYEEASELASSEGWRRLVIDEPQDGSIFVVDLGVFKCTAKVS